MTFRDYVVVSTGNLRRLKLRTFLTASGVLIAIGAFVAMLSFGAGNQENVEREFNKLGLFTTMQVYPKQRGEQRNMPGGRPPGREGRQAAEEPAGPKLDDVALDRFAHIPGVNLVYPYDPFTVDVAMRDTIVPSKAQALPSAALRTKLFSEMIAGVPFGSDRSDSVVISEELMKEFGFGSADSVLGRSLVLSVRVSTLDSGLAHILVDRGETLLDRAERIHFDSLFNSRYRSRVIRDEAGEVLRRFMNGFMNSRQLLTDTLTVCGIRKGARLGRTRGEEVIVPVETARRLSKGGLGGSPTDMYAALSSGAVFSQPDDPAGKTYSQVTIDFDPKVPYKTIRDSVEAMGYRTFSFAAEFEEIQRFFLYFDLGLGVLGLIALLTASLGIVNTMVMSITERRREIGVLKSLGADDADIRILFLVESGVIGTIGTLGGIFAGWVVTRIISAVARAYMQNQGMPPMEVFSLPPWLFLLALGVGVGVSVLAGYYPASRAARVDPVEALRND